MTTTTHIAYCGACGEPMILIVTADACWFTCTVCTEQTTPRSTVQEADLDVVWVPVNAPAQKRKSLG